MTKRIFYHVGLSVLLATLVCAALFWPQGTRVGAQTAQIATTSSAAMTRTDTSIALSSDTGVSAGTYLYVGRELMRAQSEQGTSARWNVQRGLGDGGTPATAHANAATVHVMATGGSGESYFTYDIASGDVCSTAEERFLPRINVRTGQKADCEGGYWLVWNADPLLDPAWRDGTVRDSFEQGYTWMENDGTIETVTDAGINWVTGSPLGVIQYRVELTTTLTSFLINAGRLAIGADDDGAVDNEGAEFTFGSGLIGTAGAYGRFLRTGTSGGCIASSFTVADVSATDQLMFGFRINDEAMLDNASMTYDFTGTVGLFANDGSIITNQIATDAEALDDDDSGVNMADATTRAVKYCISKTGVPTVFYTAALTVGSFAELHPAWITLPLDTTEAGTTFTADVDMVPYLSFLHTSEAVAAGIFINWIELTRFP